MRRLWLSLALIPLVLTLVFIAFMFKRHGGSAPDAQSLSPSQTDVDNAVPLPPSPEALAELNSITQLSPISLSVTNQPAGKAADMLAEALGEHQPFRMQGNTSRLVSLDVKDQPFWETVQAFQAQVPSGFVDLGPGLTLDAQLSPVSNVSHFEIQDPVILFPQTIAYERSENLRPDSALHSPGRYLLTLGAAVDPRLALARSYPVQPVSATDDHGRPIAGITMVKSNFSPSLDLSAHSNYWVSSLAIPDLSPAPAWISLTCRVRFAVLHQKPDLVMDEALQNVGKAFTVGGRTLVLSQLKLEPISGTVQFASQDGQPITDLICTISDAEGKTNAFPVTNGGVRGFPREFKAPLRLAFAIGTVGPDVAIPIELKQVPLP